MEVRPPAPKGREGRSKNSWRELTGEMEILKINKEDTSKKNE